MTETSKAPENNPCAQGPHYRLKKWLIFFFGTSLLLVYGFFQMAYHLDKPYDNGIVKAMSIAMGLSTAENGYQLRGSKNNGKDTCKYQGKYIRNFFCFLPVTAHARNGCARWRLENWYPPECRYLRGHAYLLSQPKALGKALHALENPCQYLPSPEMVETNYALNHFDGDDMEDRVYKNILIDNWKTMDCGRSRKGFTGKLIISFYDEYGEEMTRIIRHPKK